MRVLMVTNKVKTYGLGFQNVVEPLLEQGHRLIWAADFSGFVGDRRAIPCEIEQIAIHSNPLQPTNLKAYRQLVRIIDAEKIEAVMCSTPIGGMLGRLAARGRRIVPVIYASHGFLFFKGAPWFRNAIFRLQEKIMARWTDVLININEEDYCAAEKFTLRGMKKHYLVHGAGVEVGRQVLMDRQAKRDALGVPKDAVAIVAAGFLNRNKNHRVLLEALARLSDKKYCCLICGEGALRETLEKLTARLGIEAQVKFLGYRTDVLEIMAASDLFAMPSFREGAPRALLEAMDLGVACVGSDTRGIRELIGEHGEGGYICNPRSPEAFANAIVRATADEQARIAMARRNQAMVRRYSAETVRTEMNQIFSEVLRRR